MTPESEAAKWAHSGEFKWIDDRVVIVCATCGTACTAAETAEVAA